MDGWNIISNAFAHLLDTCILKGITRVEILQQITDVRYICLDVEKVRMQVCLHEILTFTATLIVSLNVIESSTLVSYFLYI